MKMLKVATLGALALAVAGSASAQTYVKVTGSTAFRKAFYYSVICATKTGRTAAHKGAAGSLLDGATQGIVHGNLVSDNSEVYVQTCFAGSVGGVEVVAKNLNAITGSGASVTASWMSNANTLTVLAADGTGSNPIASPVFEAVGSTADAATSDSFQASTPFKTTPALVDCPVGVVDFLWVKGNTNAVPAANWNRFKNMHWQAANALFSNGAIPLSMVTGDCQDDDFTVMLTGRDPDSGTRLAAELEAQFNPGNDPVQFQPLPYPLPATAPATIDTAGNQVWPAGSLFGKAYPDGALGYASGGTLAGTIKIPVDAAATDAYRGVGYGYASYFGRNDAKTASSTGANWLSFDGSYYYADLVNYPANLNISDANTLVGLAGTANTRQFCPVTRGQYTFWTYQHLLYRPTTSGTKLKVLTDLCACLKTNASISGIATTQMKVKRDTDGGTIATNLW